MTEKARWTDKTTPHLPLAQITPSAPPQSTGNWQLATGNYTHHLNNRVNRTHCPAKNLTIKGTNMALAVVGRILHEKV